MVSFLQKNQTHESPTQQESHQVPSDSQFIFSAEQAVPPFQPLLTNGEKNAFIGPIKIDQREAYLSIDCKI